ncbi:pseudouridine synthase [Candidatus Peregrinibacteria bacterium CG_4_10_14_0_2_um_filter_43_11]|nr:MAG: pseudouridine synthase [Candidatus Peregrinibacteria bacterium CG_4_10_14_0_2_um_filter_43_11]
MQMRLNKYLAELGIASRREADRLIEAGKIKVNGKVVTEMGLKVDPEKDKVEASDAVYKDREQLIYIALNKPAGYVCSAKATPMEPDIALDLINIPERIYPVGRLDKDTTGLLILTNDGTLTFALTHPSAQCEKEYEVKVRGVITHEAIRRLESGVKLWGEKTLPTIVKQLATSIISITLREGKNRQIRRICQKVGFPVRGLKRVRIKRLHLGDLPLGRWRYLTLEEVKMLKS